MLKAKDELPDRREGDVPFLPRHRHPKLGAAVEQAIAAIMDGPLETRTRLEIGGEAEMGLRLEHGPQPAAVRNARYFRARGGDGRDRRGVIEACHSDRFQRFGTGEIMASRSIQNLLGVQESSTGSSGPLHCMEVPGLMKIWLRKNKMLMMKLIAEPFS